MDILKVEPRELEAGIALKERNANMVKKKKKGRKFSGAGVDKFSRKVETRRSIFKS